MTKLLNRNKESYSEVEAAEYLNISIVRLHSLLDEYIFNDGTLRPKNLSFCDADLVLLGFWLKSQGNSKVIRMPRRN